MLSAIMGMVARVCAHVLHQGRIIMEDVLLLHASLQVTTSEEQHQAVLELQGCCISASLSCLSASGPTLTARVKSSRLQVRAISSLRPGHILCSLHALACYTHCAYMRMVHLTPRVRMTMSDHGAPPLPTHSRLKIMSQQAEEPGADHPSQCFLTFMSHVGHRGRG